MRTNPTAEQAKAISSLDICRSICGSVFIMLLNDNVFTDEVRGIHCLISFGVIFSCTYSGCHLIDCSLSDDGNSGNSTRIDFYLQISLHLLSIAIAYRTPIIFIRESGYQLPTNIADAAIKCVKIPDDAPFRPQRAAVSMKLVSGRRERGKRDEERREREREREGEGREMRVRRELQRRRER